MIACVTKVVKADNRASSALLAVSLIQIYIAMFLRCCYLAINMLENAIMAALLFTLQVKQFPYAEVSYIQYANGILGKGDSYTASTGNDRTMFDIRALIAFARFLILRNHCSCLLCAYHVSDRHCNFAKVPSVYLIKVSRFVEVITIGCADCTIRYVVPYH